MSEYQYAGTTEEIVAALEGVMEKVRAGLPVKAAFRLYLADGTYEDIVFAPTKEEEDELRADLLHRFSKLN